MSETVRRRRWPWVVLVTTLVIVGGPIAYRFRPLNAAERALVGRWTDNGGEFATIFQLNPNRTMVDHETVGSWSASGTTLYLHSPVGRTDGLAWGVRLSLYIAHLSSARIDFRWEGPDRFYVKGAVRGEIAFSRIPAESTSDL